MDGWPWVDTVPKELVEEGRNGCCTYSRIS